MNYPAKDHSVLSKPAGGTGKLRETTVTGSEGLSGDIRYHLKVHMLGQVQGNSYQIF